MTLQEKLEAMLIEIDGVTFQTVGENRLRCVIYHGKEIAHFQAVNALDVRLSRKFIREEGLKRSEDSPFHPERSKNSRWMVRFFHSEADVAALAALIVRLIAAEYAPAG